MKLASYKGTGTWYAKLIRVWTGGPYSHSELVFDQISPNLFFSSSERDGGVRFKQIEAKKENWDFICLPLTWKEEVTVYRWCTEQVEKGYDWKGILLSQCLPFKKEDPNKWFCSEICAAALLNWKKDLLKRPASYHPNKLHKLMEGYKYGMGN